MQNFEKSEKSRGIVALAFNTDITDYVSIAQKTLTLASKTLGLPYHLITESDSEFQNNRYDIDTQQFVQWKNAGRYLAYEHSPFQETLVIDVDYLVLDDSLLKVFELDFDYLFMRDAIGVWQQFPKTMGRNSLPYVWATVFAFRKTARADMFFDMVKRVQKNYAYFCQLFNIEERNYRNDYAFAIADIVLNGHTLLADSVPGPMINVDRPITSITKRGNQLIIRDEQQAYVLPRTNLHIMSKSYLQSEQFQEFLTHVTA